MHETNTAGFDRQLDEIGGLLAAGRTHDAIFRTADLVRRAPRHVEALRLHGVGLMQAGRLAEALDVLRNARDIAPTSVEVLCNLGSAELAAGDPAAALAVLGAAFAVAPQHPAVLVGLGNARRAAGDLAGARDAYREATRVLPDHLGAWANLAAVELASGDAENAERNVRRALALAPGHPEILLLLGHVLGARRRYAEAETAYAQGARSAPSEARFPYQVGLMAEEQKHYAAAAAAHASALALDASLHHALGQLVFLKRQLCDWRDLDSLSAELRRRVAARARGIAPFAFLSEPASAEEQLLCARTCAAEIEERATPLRARLAWTHARRRRHEPVRVGFVSNGFGNHPTGLLIVALIEALRAHGLDAHLFSTARDDGSDIARRLQNAGTWHDAADIAPTVLAERLHAAALDVLIDLRGYGGGSVADALALRPAPVQVNWLAYPGTSGAPWIDYVIADRVVMSDTVRAGFSERVATLARCFQPSDPSRIVGDPPSRTACGLPAHGTVYVSFNNSYKLNPPSMSRMFDVLRRVPDSVLWLLSAPDGADERLRAAARGAGIDPARLVAMPKLAHMDYLARYRHADLFLDTHPYNAHTTASDAIWAGCPVLTCPGGTFASRVAASLNHHLGMPELNARDDAEFVDIAVRIGTDANARDALRAKLAAHRAASGLFDMQGFAKDFADLLRTMANRYRAGAAPADIG